MQEQRHSGSTGVPLETQHTFGRFILPRHPDQPHPPQQLLNLPIQSPIPIPPAPVPDVPNISIANQDLQQFLASLPPDTHKLLSTFLQNNPTLPLATPLPPQPNLVVRPVPVHCPTSISGPPGPSLPVIPSLDAYPKSPLENLNQYLDFTRKLQRHLTQSSDNPLSDADLECIHEIAKLPLPNAFTVPVCQEWVNFASTFHGNVKLTLDPKNKSNRFKFEFFQQIALFYCIKNFIENRNEPQQPSDEVNLNQMSYTDRMDVITTSVVSVLNSLYEKKVEVLKKEKEEVQKALDFLNEKTSSQNCGYGYFFSLVDPTSIRGEIFGIPMETGGLTMYKVTFIGTTEVVLRTGNAQEDGKDIKTGLTNVKRSMRSDCIFNSATISISDDEITIHIPKSSRIPLTKLVCLYVDGVDKNFFCIGYYHMNVRKDTIKLLVFCTTTLASASEIAQNIHTKAVGVRPISHRVIRIQV